MEKLPFRIFLTTPRPRHGLSSQCHAVVFVPEADLFSHVEKNKKSVWRNSN